MVVYPAAAATIAAVVLQALASQAPAAVHPAVSEPHVPVPPCPILLYREKLSITLAKKLSEAGSWIYCRHWLLYLLVQLSIRKLLLNRFQQNLSQYQLYYNRSLLFQIWPKD